MSSVLVALVLPFAGAFLMLLMRDESDRVRGGMAALLALTSFGFVLRGTPIVLSSGPLHATWPWFPGLGIRLGFYVDGLGLLFALLISGVGALVALYAVGYLHDDRVRDGFWFALMLFMGSMLGLVLSDDTVLLVVFWELTSVASFLLIGLRYWKEDARRGALNALFVTAIGGLALLVAVLLLGAETGTYSLVAWFETGVPRNPVVSSAMLLILLAAFTKSAHFPFHFWLPQAMAAPTPVSAYLHSATMVKAGVYLIARMFPLFAGYPGWTSLVLGTGLVTFLAGGILAVGAEDLKQLLAYSTVSQLGMMTFMLGLNTAAAVFGSLLHLVAHATFKGGLFMGAGAIERTLGTRDLRELGPLWQSMPIVAVLMIGGALSMAGVIPFAGFVSKEAMFEGLVTLGYWKHALWLTGALAGSLITVLYSLRLMHGLPFSPARLAFQGPSDHHSPDGSDYVCLVVPTALLVGLTLIIGPWVGAGGGGLVALLDAAGHAVGSFSYHFALWHGFTRPLGLTAVALGGGLLLYAVLAASRGLWQGLAAIPGPETFNRVFHDNLVPVSRRVLRVIIRGPLNKYLRLMLGFVVLVVVWAWVQSDAGSVSTFVPNIAVSYRWLPFVLVGLGSLGILGFDRPVPAVVALGVIGFLVSLVYLVYRAPDLILTQIAVETVSIVIFLWVLKDISFDDAAALPLRGGDLLFAGVTAGGLGYFLMRVLDVKQGLTVPARYYVRTALSEAGGRNMVNVILVDFRALDTLGEISVLGIATVGVLALLRVVFNRTSREGEV